MKDDKELLDVFDRIVGAANWSLEYLEDYVMNEESIEKEYDSLDAALGRAGELRNLLMEAINAGK